MRSSGGQLGGLRQCPLRPYPRTHSSHSVNRYNASHRTMFMNLSRWHLPTTRLSRLPPPFTTLVLDRKGDHVMTAQSLLHELRGVGLIWLPGLSRSVFTWSFTCRVLSHSRAFCLCHEYCLISKCTVHLRTTDCLLLPDALPTNALVIPHVDIYTYRTQTPGITCRISWTIDTLVFLGLITFQFVARISVHDDK